MARSTRFALIAGGGTAGHVTPALAVARVLQARRGAASVEIVGARRGLEASLLDRCDVPVTLLGGAGIVRRADRASLVANARAVAGLIGATGKAVALVAHRRPAVVVSVGGYACLPAAVAATILGVPVVVCNVDAVPGLANRLVGTVARASAVAYRGTPLPRAVVTGAPVAQEIADVAGAGVGGPSSQARDRLGVPPDRSMVVVVGGSLGAQRLNQAALELAGLWSDRSDIALYHVVGRRDARWAQDAAVGLVPPAGGSLWYRQVVYEEQMAVVYQAADVLVGRAGAMTVAELAVVGLPAVLVPLPGSPGDHQRANATMLADAGAAVVLHDEQCTGAALAAILDPLLADPGRRRTMAAAGARLGHADAAEHMASVAEAHARAGWATKRRTW